jgi:hypothetical protein
MIAYPIDLQLQILRACDSDFNSQHAFADPLSASESPVEKLSHRRQTTSEIAEPPDSRSLLP